jgi:hypothetical protein
MICWTDRIDVAYFENSFDALLGVVDRSTFETRLRSFFNHKPTLQDDPAWYALRHTDSPGKIQMLISWPVSKER